MKYGVYISGPGIVGHMLMRDLSPRGQPPALFVFDTKLEARVVKDAMQEIRPNHIVSVAPYQDGDEHKGQYAADPDGYTP